MQDKASNEKDADQRQDECSSTTGILEACFEFGIAICASANQTDYGPSLYRFEFHQFVPLGKGAGSHRRAPLFGHGALRYGQQNRSPQLSLRRAGLFLFQIEGSAGCTGLGGT